MTISLTYGTLILRFGIFLHKLILTQTPRIGNPFGLLSAVFFSDAILRRALPFLSLGWGPGAGRAVGPVGGGQHLLDDRGVWLHDALKDLLAGGGAQLLHRLDDVLETMEKQLLRDPAPAYLPIAT